MESSSPFQKLCQNLIGFAFQRCRISENLCRLSVALKCSTNSDLPIVRISISDTGIGSCLDAFQDLDYAISGLSSGKWDGVLSVTTTSICDKEVYHYRLNLKENVVARRLKRLPTTPKNGGKFSGTEISLSTYESIDDLLTGMVHFLRKMLILKIPKVTVELVVDRTGNSQSRSEHLFLANEGIPSPSAITTIERLVSGLEDHVLKHGNALDTECRSCFLSSKHLKVGTGATNNSESLRSTGQVIDVVIIITELPGPSSPSCLRACGTKTEVLYYQEFLPCAIPQSSLHALKSIDWKGYGLSLRTDNVSEDGHLTLEWENLPPYSHIDMVIHCYNKQTLQVRKKNQFDRNLVKKAVKLAMDDLKGKYAGILLSAQALKVQSYVPDLARTIAGLILSSKDLEFQGECVTLLGLPHEEIDQEVVGDCIRKKITHVIELNDRKPPGSKESAPFLFEDESLHKAELQDEDEDEDEEDFDIWDL